VKTTRGVSISRRHLFGAIGLGACAALATACGATAPSPTPVPSPTPAPIPTATLPPPATPTASAPPSPTAAPRKVRLAVKSASSGNPDLFAVDLATAAKQLPKDSRFVLDLVTIITDAPIGSTAAQIAESYATNVAGADADVIAADHATLRPLAIRGVLQDLGPLLGKQTWFKKEDYVGNILQVGQIRGAQVGLPLDAAVDVVGYSKSRFKEPGIADPTLNWTWDDLIATAKKLTTGERWGLQVSAWSPNVLSLAWQYGADVVSPSGKILVTEPGMIQALTLLDRLLNVEKVSPPLDKAKPLAQDDDPFSTAWLGTEAGISPPDVEQLNQGRIAMLATLSTRPGDAAWWRKASFYGFAEDVVPLPRGDRAAAFGTSFTIVAIPKKVANLDQSIAALRDLVELANQSEVLAARRTDTSPRQRVSSLSERDSSVLTAALPNARFLPGDVSPEVYQHLAADLVLPVLTGQKKPKDAAADAQKLIDAAMAV
jgi:ABC-type glycerol-3-phosphate transport system substrate-binding protein